MLRRPPEEEPHHHRERWMVSYADFITLLFAFFVVMYAISTLNEGKYRVVSDSLTAAFRRDRVVGPPPGGFVPMAVVPLPITRPIARSAVKERALQEEKLRGLAAQIVQTMQPLVQTGQVNLRETARGLAVEISASVLFAPAQATLRPESVAALQAVVGVLRSVAISVELGARKRALERGDSPVHCERHAGGAARRRRLRR
jgi:chemotaxis protein MotB